MFSATSSSSNVSLDIRTASFNCHGLKSSMEYTAQLSSENHVTFLCEHCLLPNDIHTIWDTFSKAGKTSFLKSSVDPLVPLRGCPYVVIGFVCCCTDGYSYKFINCKSDWLCGLNVFMKGKIVLTIFGVFG